MLRIPDLYHRKHLRRIPLLRFTPRVLCPLIENVRNDGLNPTVANFAANLLVLEPKFVFLWRKNPIRCDFLSFRLVGWFVVIWYYF